MLLYLNGRWHSRALSAEDAQRFGFCFGLGIFTTMGVRRGRPLFLAQHLDRLEANARLMHLHLPARERLRALVLEGVRRGGPDSGVIKVMVAHATRGGGRKANAPRVALLVMPKRPVPQSVDLLISHFVPTRWHAHKLTAYLDAAILAGRARVAGCFDALAVADSELLDTSMANIFRIDRSGIQTPPADGRILPGIARNRLLAAKSLGIREQPLYLRDLDGAQGLFLTNSVRGVMPVTRLLDGRGNTVWRPKKGGLGPAAVREAYECQLARDSSDLE